MAGTPTPASSPTSGDGKVPGEERRIRVLLAKPGLDTHERGIKLVATALRDAGMELIYAGVFQTSESIVNAALEEDVDVIGLSYLNGAYKPLTREILDALRDQGLDHVPVICGGIIPQEDVPALRAMGVAAVYGPGTPLEQIVAGVEKLGQRG